MKICWKCDKKKPLSEFNKNSRRPDGLQTSCWKCQAMSSRKYYHNPRNKDRMIQQTNEARAVRLGY